MKKLFALSMMACLLTAASVQAFDFGKLGDLEKLGKQLEKAKQKTKYLRGDVSIEEERAMGRQIAATLISAAPAVQDKALQRYVNQVGAWVAQQSERPDLQWTFAVLDTNTVNAFAAPGGYVFITKPLFLLLQNEAELAGVLGHEISHVVQKHHVKELQKQSGMNLLLQGALKAGDKNLASKDRKSLDKLLGASKTLYTKGLSRGDEHDADKRGVVLSARAGYDPYAFMNVLSTLNEIDPNDKSLALMTNTHPSTQLRLEVLDKVVDSRLKNYAGMSLVEKRFQGYKAGLLK